VRDERTNIDGILNAIKDGRIGGNVWFANPNGFIVGNGGVVNVGSLNVLDPEPASSSTISSPPGSPTDASVTQLSTAPPAHAAGTDLDPGEGERNRRYHLSAGVITVGGRCMRAARFLARAGLHRRRECQCIASATNIRREGRPHPVVADGDVTVSGNRCRTGRRRVRGGDISIKAGGNIDLQAGANIVRAAMARFCRRHVSIWADNDATIRSARAWMPAPAPARLADSSNSARRTMSVLAGGQMIAESRRGRPGPYSLTRPI